MDEKGLRVNRAWHFRWRGAVGYAHVTGPWPAIFLVGRGGKATLLPLPVEPNGSAVLEAVQSRIRPLSPSDLALYRRPIALTVLEVTGVTLLAFLNALVAAGVFPPLLRAMPTALSALAVLACLCLPACITATIYFSRRYPQFWLERYTVAISVWCLTLGQAAIFSLAFVTRELGRLEAAV
jgi:hypothetical protein